MNIQEFSNTFDTLLNSYNTQAMFGEAASKREITLDEYEKSVMLTQAQDIIVKSYFDRMSNPLGQGFDDSIRRQLDFSSLIKTSRINIEIPVGGSPETDTYDDRGVLVTLNPDILLILNEKVIDSNGTSLVVVPINYKEYDRQLSRAYTQPLKKQVWRLFENDSNSELKSELIPISGTTMKEYRVRYLRRPRPIVLTDLTADGLDIDGVDTPNENGIACELHPIIHMDILNKAVELAINTRGGRVAQAEPASQTTTTRNQ